MIKFMARGVTDGRELIGLGLSHVNLDRLREGRPIMVRGDWCGAPVDVLIFAGRTEETMLADVESAGMEIRDAAAEKAPSVFD